MLGKARTAVLVWSMGVTQHEYGEDNVRAIINLGLTKGFVGRDKCGLMPIRGHSGVQGGAEMGAYATVLPGGLPIDEANAARFSALWGFEVPATTGMTAPEMIDAADEGRLDVLVSSGGNFLEVLPDPDWCRRALGRVPLRVHADIVLSSQMLVDPADTVVLLPAATRYEIPGGVTETSTERRVIFSPEVPGPRIGEARPEWQVFVELATRVRPELAERLHYQGTAAIRADIARAIPAYDGIQHLAKFGDQFQYGGPHLCAGWRFPTPDGKAHFSVVPLPSLDQPEGTFRVATRRGKQFNSMVHEQVDPSNQAVREAVLVSRADAEPARPRQRRPGGAAQRCRRVPRPGPHRPGHPRQPPGPLARRPGAHRPPPPLAAGGHPRLQRLLHPGEGGRARAGPGTERLRVMMVLRPGSKIRTTTVSSRPGKSTLPFSCRMALPRTIEVQGTTAGHLARAVAGERNHGAAGAAPLVERARQMATVNARQGQGPSARTSSGRRAGSGRRSPPGAAKGRRAW